MSGNVPMTLEEQNALIQSSFAYAKAITDADPVKVEAERQAAIKERSVPRSARNALGEIVPMNRAMRRELRIK